MNSDDPAKKQEGEWKVEAWVICAPDPDTNEWKVIDHSPFVDEEEQP